MEKLAQQLLEDAKNRYIHKDDLLIACLETMTEDQLYEMSINNEFIKTSVESDDYVTPHPDQSTPEKIIDAVLARYGE